MPADGDGLAALETLLGILAAPGLQVAPVLHDRLAEVARAMGTASAWDWVERQTGRQLAEPVRAEMEGAVLGWLTFVRPVKQGLTRGKTADLVSRVGKALDDDPAFGTYLPVLHQLADKLQQAARAERGSVTRDKQLIRQLADVFDRAGGKVTSAPTGEFCRLLAAVWEILPSDQRCASPETLVQYVKTAWDCEPTSPLRKRPRRRKS
jgi:hypothetical protein